MVLVLLVVLVVVVVLVVGGSGGGGGGGGGGGVFFAGFVAFALAVPLAQAILVIWRILESHQLSFGKIFSKPEKVHILPLTQCYIFPISSSKKPALSTTCPRSKPMVGAPQMHRSIAQL